MSSIKRPTRCAACKYLRRRCSEDCILAPYFPSTDPERFTCVHKIFGAGNVTRMLQKISVHERAEAANSIFQDAYWRVQDPVYGSVGIISRLRQQIEREQQELVRTQAQIAIYTAHNQMNQQHGLQKLEEEESLPFSDICQLPDFLP